MPPTWPDHPAVSCMLSLGDEHLWVIMLDILPSIGPCCHVCSQHIQAHKWHTLQLQCTTMNMSTLTVMHNYITIIQQSWLYQPWVISTTKIHEDPINRSNRPPDSWCLTRTRCLSSSSWSASHFGRGFAVPWGQVVAPFAGCATCAAGKG